MGYRQDDNKDDKNTLLVVAVAVVVVVCFVLDSRSWRKNFSRRALS
jgi:hypothetical protein